MEMVYTEESFPCGYTNEKRITRFSLIGLIIPMPIKITDDGTDCPLHGRRCEAKKLKARKR